MHLVGVAPPDLFKADRMDAEPEEELDECLPRRFNLGVLFARECPGHELTAFTPNRMSGVPRVECVEIRMILAPHRPGIIAMTDRTGNPIQMTWLRRE